MLIVMLAYLKDVGIASDGVGEAIGETLSHLAGNALGNIVPAGMQSGVMWPIDSDGAEIHAEDLPEDAGTAMSVLIVQDVKNESSIKAKLEDLLKKENVRSVLNEAMRSVMEGSDG